ncbi:MAG: S-adenosylmethionine:tRNA ribosyltransferase-isomerase [Neobacillus sp.]
MLQEKISFNLPSTLNADVPPERRGVRRDQVKLMIQNRTSYAINHDRFFNLDLYLEKGDVLLLNSSRTIPALLKANHYRNNTLIRRGLEIRLARKLNDFKWEMLIDVVDIRVNDYFIFSSRLNGTVRKITKSSPLVTMEFSKKGTELFNEIYTIGEPIRYEYIKIPWGLEYYQTVFATHPGSVEMPSAGRAFSWELLFKLKQKGVRVVFLQLHTGLSYLLDDKWDHSPKKNPEKYDIPIETWGTVLGAKLEGKRIIAAGTTVVRAIETAAANGCLSGWTNLYIKQDYKLNLVDGIITGMHEPEASHLEMLSAFVDRKGLLNGYKEAINRQYLWHEFGDMTLII